MRAYYNDIHGSDNASPKTEGPGILSDLYFNYYQSIGEDRPIEIDALTYFHGTDDPRFEIKGDEVRLQNGYVTVRQEESFEVTGGYFSENFSEWTINQSALGLSGSYYLTDNFKFKTFGGRTQRHIANQQYDRFAWGSQLKLIPFENQTISLNYTRTKDDLTSLSDDEDNVNNPVDNSVTSLKYTGDLVNRGIYLEAEFAESQSDPGRTGRDVDHKHAQRANASFRPFSATRIRMKYERVDPLFITRLGFASTNRETYQFRAQQDIGLGLSLSTDLEWWNDGLEGLRETNDVDNYKTSLNFDRKFTENWDGEVELGFEQRINEGRNPGIDPSGFNDAEERIYNILVSNQFYKNDLNVEYYQEDDDLADEKIMQWDLQYRLDFLVFDLPMRFETSPLYEINEQQNMGQAQEDYRIDWGNRLVLGADLDQSINLQYDYLMDDPARSGEVVTNFLKTGYRHIWSRKYDSSVEFSMSIRDRNDHDSSSRSFLEEVIELTLSTKF